MAKESIKVNQSQDVAAQETIEQSGRDDDAMKNLAGFFDVLIQMDLEQKSKERNKDGATAEEKN